MNMELDELKSAWESVGRSLDNVGGTDTDMASVRKLDVKTRLERRVGANTCLTLVSMIIMITSPLWAVAVWPVSWLIAFCAVGFIGFFAELRLLHIIRRIDIWNMNHIDTIKSLIRIKRYYRNIELVFLILFGILLIWLSLTPPFVGGKGMFVVWGLTAAASLLEFFFYRKNTQYLNTLLTWENEMRGDTEHE